MPKEVQNEAFVREVRGTLDAARPVLATVHYRSTGGFLGWVTPRDDAELIEVMPETRDALPAALTARLGRALDD